MHSLMKFNKILRIHDYKSGITPAKMDQLMIYAALFCLEYKKESLLILQQNYACIKMEKL